jgi:hypothetical protein
MAYTSIDDPSAYFQTVTWTGNGTDGRTITLPGSTDMQPDFIWVKNRTDGEDHCLMDSVRTFASGKAMRTNGGDEEGGVGTANRGWVEAASDGFTCEDGSSNANLVNASSDTYVAWCWKAGTTSGIGTSGQDITPSGYSINTTSKFGIYAYGGNGTDDQQINHGLGVAPKFIIQKARSNASQDWHVFHAKNTSAPETDYIYLNGNSATVDRLESWSDELPDATDITLGTSNDGNQSGQTFIMYAWGEVQGFSKFGTYTGNGNADGIFIYTGFRPAWGMFKKTDSGTADWEIMDNKRAGYNDATYKISANANYAENTDTGRLEILSNGFKIRTTGTGLNTSGGTYIYVAFAEAPFVNSNGVPNNAR